MIPAIRSTAIDIAPVESFVNLKVGILHGYSFFGGISYNRNIEHLYPREEREIARIEYSQVAQIASRIFTEFGEGVSHVHILSMSFAAVPDRIIKRIVSSLRVALLNISRSRQEEDDEFRVRTPSPIPMSDPGVRPLHIVSGLLVTPPMDPSTRVRVAIEDESSYTLTGRFHEETPPPSIPLPQQGVAAAPARPLRLPRGYQFSTPPRPPRLDPVEQEPNAPLPQMPLVSELHGGDRMRDSAEEMSPIFRGSLFDHSDGPQSSGRGN